MAEVFAKSDAPSQFVQWLVERPDWPLKYRLLMLQRLARQVQALHQNGRIHRAIGIDALTLDEELQPVLPPPPGPRRFGGADGDPESCPPELVGGAGVLLPEEIEAAAKILQQAGHAIDPRRIDVYQLGVLLCRLITGERIAAYIYDPKIKGRVPALIGSLLERTLGFETVERFENCETVLEALGETLRKTEMLEAPTSAIETPPLGSAVLLGGDTPPRGIRRPSDSPTDIIIPNQRLGHFRIIERIGSGGMGDVYRAYDESLDRHVAIKVLPAQLARDADFVRRFHAEATAAASLSHPNIVPIYFIGEDAGHHFFAMQFVDGESLAERLGRKGRLEANESLELVGQCLSGLQAAHARGLIHRDVKPGNVLIERESGRAMLVDFGLVRRINESARMTATGIVMGTVDYIAPEQARGQKVDGRADIYSLGVLFYHLLSGRLPFVADSPTAMIFQHAYEPPFPLEQAAPDILLPVVEIVARMMAKDPAQRYSDCAAVLADLAAYRRDQPLPSHALDGDLLKAIESDDESAVSDGLAKLLGPTNRRRLNDLAETMFRRHAPEFVQQLRGTSYQMDAAVGHCQRRRNRLAKLCEEAKNIERELGEQLRASEAAGDAATRAEEIAALRSQLELQHGQVEDLEGQLCKADATLAQLCSQQNLLKARLQAAEAHRQLEGNLSRPRKSRLWIAAAAVSVILFTAVMLMLIMPRPAPPPSNAPVPDKPPDVASTKVEPKAEPSSPKRPKPNPKLPPGAILLMTFERDTILEQFGNIFAVYNLTGRYNGQNCTAQFTPNGKVGGALLIEDEQEVRIGNSLVCDQPNYTITAWINRKDKHHLWVYSVNSGSIIYGINAMLDGRVMVATYNDSPPQQNQAWKSLGIQEKAVVAGRWTFLAVRLIDGKMGSGKLTIRVNEKSHELACQSVHHGAPRESLIGAATESTVRSKHGLSNGMVDEMAIYQRALSDAEIETIYQMGLHGESLGM